MLPWGVFFTILAQGAIAVVVGGIAVYAAALMVGSAIGVFRNAARAEPAPQPAKPKEPAKS